MFSSNHIPCSPNAFSPPDSFFNYHNPFISGDFAIQQQLSGFQYADQDQDQADVLDSVITIKNKTAASMKDGHTKIYTARGLRDRRVRLSIDIARKFFCLQDLLGFDKPSKTLDWLLTKSLTAIKDLVEQTNQCSSSTRFLEAIMRDSDEETGPRKKKMTQRCRADNVSRYQSRTDARARARERTKQRLRVKRFDDQETWKMSKDSSFLIGAILEDPVVNDLDLE